MVATPTRTRAKKVAAPARMAASEQKVATATPRGPQFAASVNLAGLQHTAGNQAVQRLIDGFYAGGKTKVPKSRIALTPAFKTKHVAEDEKNAIAITGARIETGKPAAMVNGSLANTVAKEADWLAAIDESTAVIPDQDAWEGGLALKVTGWNAKRVPGQRLINLTGMAAEARTVGGFMAKAGGAVKIDHVAGV